MTKAKTTKRALLTSVLSMMLCMAMLVGSTFAWFTDSVTSGKNKIVAGNLDVELDYAVLNDDGSIKEWKSVEGESLFDENALWEPGYTQVVYLKVRNAGTLALKYKLAVNVEKETTGINVEGEELRLSEHLVFGQVGSATEMTPYATREAAWEAVGSTQGLNDYTKNSNLAAGAEEYVALVVYMPTTVGNEANYRGEVTPTIELGVNLFATQDTVESDSFGNDYDRVAALIQDGYAAVATADDLNKALADGKNVVLTEDIKVTNSVLKAAEGTVIDGDGNKLIGMGTDNEHQGLQLAKNVEYRNIVFELEKGWGVITKSATFINCTFNAASPYLTPTAGGDIVVDGCTLVDTVLQICYNEGEHVDPATIKTTIINNKFIVNNTDVRAHAMVLGGGSPEFWANGAETVTMTGNTFTPKHEDTSYIAYYIYGDYNTTLTSVPVYKDNTYNGDACYSINSTEESNRHPLKIKVTSTEELAAALEDPNGEVLELSAGRYELPSSGYTLPAGTSIIGDGNTTLVVDGKTSSKGMLISGDDVTIKNVTLEGTEVGSYEYNSVVRIQGDNVTLENVTIDSKNNASPIVISSTASDDNVITIKNCNITAGFKAIHIIDGTRGTVNIDCCTIDAVYPFNVNTGSALKVVVTDSILKGWVSYGESASKVVFNSCQFGRGHGYAYVVAYADTDFVNCTFSDGFCVQTKNNKVKTMTFTNCNKNGTKLTAENVKEQFHAENDSDSMDQATGWTVIVDGATVETKK